MKHPKGTINEEKENFTAAPLAVDGKILVGQSGGDDLTRGWLAAVDAATGAEVWRTYMVPGPGEPGHETWKDTNQAWKVGGAALWTTGTYDPETNLTYWGTGNAQPMFDVEYRPGDNLFAGAVVAMDVKDGAIKWHFQYTPNEGWDYDENGVHQLIKLDINGEPRKVIGALGPERLLLSPRRDERAVPRRQPVRRDGELDEGHRPEDRQARRIRPEPGGADLHSGNAHAARRSGRDVLPALARRRALAAAGL